MIGAALKLIEPSFIDLKVKKVSNFNKRGETEVKNRVMCSLGVMRIRFDCMDNND